MLLAAAHFPGMTNHAQNHPPEISRARPSGPARGGGRMTRASPSRLGCESPISIFRRNRRTASSKSAISITRATRITPRKWWRRSTGLHPQFVCFTGDLVEEARFAPAALDFIRQIKRPVYGCPGNWDYGSRVDFRELSRKLSRRPAGPFWRIGVSFSRTSRTSS